MTKSGQHTTADPVDGGGTLYFDQEKTYRSIEHLELSANRTGTPGCDWWLVQDVARSRNPAGIYTGRSYRRTAASRVRCCLDLAFADYRVGIIYAARWRGHWSECVG